MPRRAAPGTKDLFGKRTRAKEAGIGHNSMPDPLELPIHKTILHYLIAVLPKDFIIQHTPNGGILKGEVAKAKGMGMVSGWPDLAIYGWRINPVTGNNLRFVGFMEVKRRDGKLSQDQKDVHESLADLKFPVAVVRSVEDARAMVVEWGLPTLEVIPRKAVQANAQEHQDNATLRGGGAESLANESRVRVPRQAPTGVARAPSRARKASRDAG